MAQIYAIVCNVNGWAYIGCTKPGDKFLKKRMREHRCLLRQGKHAEKLLQADWRLYGDNSFTIKTVQNLPEGCSVEVKREAETKWMEYYDAADSLYNANRNSFSPDPAIIALRVEAARKANIGRVHTDEERRKRSENNKGKHTGHGAKISATKKALGQQPSRECIEKSIRNRRLQAAAKASQSEY